jgi:RNA polymerase sigma-70 factor (ECF subfamily)
VNSLSDRQKVIFLLRYVEEMPLEEIARAMELKLGTVKSHLYRAVESVRAVCGGFR